MSLEFEVCPDCNGDKKVTCPDCQPCSYCEGSGTIPPHEEYKSEVCPVCDGREFGPCSSCGNTGEIKCGYCEGTGKVES